VQGRREEEREAAPWGQAGGRTGLQPPRAGQQSSQAWQMGWRRKNARLRAEEEGRCERRRMGGASAGVSASCGARRGLATCLRAGAKRIGGGWRTGEQGMAAGFSGGLVGKIRARVLFSSQFIYEVGFRGPLTGGPAC
jgi:hypothetical protein